MNVAYLCNAPDSGAALFNTFNDINKHISIPGKVFHRSKLWEQPWHEVEKTLEPYNVVIHDSEYCAFASNAIFPRLKHAKTQITWWHINESKEHLELKKRWLRDAAVDQIWVTDEAMAFEAGELGYDAEILPLLIDKGRFKKGPAPDKFTVGYMGADMGYKRWDAVHNAVRALPYNIAIVGARRKSHEGGEYVGREQEFYDSISCYINPSQFESGPLPPIEALQCGKPVISTPVGMMPDLTKQTKALMLCDMNLGDLPAKIKEVMANFGALLDEAAKFDFTVDYTRYEDAIKRAASNG